MYDSAKVAALKTALRRVVRRRLSHVSSTSIAEQSHRICTSVLCLPPLMVALNAGLGQSDLTLTTTSLPLRIGLFLSLILLKETDISSLVSSCLSDPSRFHCFVPRTLCQKSSVETASTVRTMKMTPISSLSQLKPVGKFGLMEVDPDIAFDDAADAKDDGGLDIMIVPGGCCGHLWNVSQVCSAFKNPPLFVVTILIVMQSTCDSECHAIF